MSKSQWLMFFGVALIIVQFMGIPTKYSTYIYLVLGILTVIVAYRSRIVPADTVVDSLPFTDHRNTDPKITSQDELNEHEGNVA